MKPILLLVLILFLASCAPLPIRRDTVEVAPIPVWVAGEVIKNQDQ